jgi:acyl-homoserine-lactone acylase
MHPAARVSNTLLVGAMTLALMGASPNQGIDQQATYEALVRRTDAGIPHISAQDFASLGFGTGYAMAEDLVCTMAEQFLTFGAERARFLGPTGQNIASDFLFQLLIDRGEAEEPVDPRQSALFRGAAAGYNRYLRDTGVDNLTDPNCQGAPWVREIGEIDFRRISRTNFFLPIVLGLIVGASPPEALADAGAGGALNLAGTGPAPALEIPTDAEIAAALSKAQMPDIDAILGEIVPRHKGSNGVAIGRDASADGTGMLLANPHQPWTGADRFYAFHQTLPGELDVVGANVIGRPQVGFGTTEHVAWTSTVSTADRFSFFALLLLDGSPTTYIFDGAPYPMIEETVTIQIPDGQGGLLPLSHTFYSTHFGAFLVAFGWSAEDDIAFAVLPADAGWRGIDSLVDQYQATSVHDLKAVHDAGQFLPVNLVAADSSGEVLFTDPGPVPNLTDTQVEVSVFIPDAGGCDFFGSIAGFLSRCQWGIDPEAAAPGLLGPSERPSLIRTDYVSNSNDSFWLANPAAPISTPGRNAVLGPEGQEQTLRTRSTNQMIAKRLAGSDGLGGSGFTLDKLQTLALSNQNHAGQILLDGLVALCTAESMPGGVDVSQACAVLANDWDVKANLDSVGAHVFREFMRVGDGDRRLPSVWSYLVPFDVSNPLTTPRDLDPDPLNNPDALAALAQAVAALADAGIAPNVALGSLQSVTRQGEVIPLHGGIEESGVFNKVEAAFDEAATPPGYREVTSSGSSWIQATEFTADGPVSRGILTYSLSTNPASPRFADQTKLYSQKQWVELPFRDEDVEAAAMESVGLVEGKDDCRNGGWQAFTNPAFANQGECVEYLDLLRQQRVAEIKARR